MHGTRVFRASSSRRVGCAHHLSHFRATQESLRVSGELAQTSRRAKVVLLSLMLERPRPRRTDTHPAHGINVNFSFWLARFLRRRSNLNEVHAVIVGATESRQT